MTTTVGSPFLLKAHSVGDTESRPRTPRVWINLAEKVRNFRPDVVVLVARKMPRIIQAYSLDFGDAVVISDLAVPFTHRLLRGARVAVLDDVVNVGSTLQRAHDSAVACGSASVKLFALGTRADSHVMAADVEYVYPGPLSSESYRSLITDVPRVLRHLARPFDLEFPIVPCRLRSPLSSAARLLDWLRDRHDHACIHDLGSFPGGNHLRRLSVDIPQYGPGLFKLRFYLDDHKRTCNLVPFAIPVDLAPGVGLGPVVSRVLDELEEPLGDCPASVSSWDEEPLVRAELFVRSWLFGLRMLDKFDDVLSLADPRGVNMSDAELLFGPVARTLGNCRLSELIKSGDLDSPHPFRENEGVKDLPHGYSLLLSEIAAKVEHRDKGRDAASLFAAIFDAIAELTGAEDTSLYALNWPYTRDEVLRNPFLRLKVGLTFLHLVELMRRLLTAEADPESAPIANLVSTLLDSAIDSGAVVPTISKVDGRFLRVYRKGENSQRDLAVQRVVYAWTNHGAPMDLTECAKINAILAYSSELTNSLWPSTLVRGNVASLQKTSLDLEGPNIAEYLRSIGAIERV